MDIDSCWHSNDIGKRIYSAGKKEVLDLGSVEINKTENKWVGWPTYAGGLLAIAGVVLVVADKKK